MTLMTCGLRITLKDFQFVTQLVVPPSAVSLAAEATSDQ